LVITTRPRAEPGAGPEAVLIGISNGYAKLGMILFEMKATAKDLARELA